MSNDRFAWQGVLSVLSPREMFSHEPIEWPDEVEMLVDRS